MNALTCINIERLAKVFALFSSNHMGERATAAYRADQIVRGAGLTWADVLQPAAAPDCDFQEHRELTPAEILARHAARLSDWERSFLTSLAARRNTWTPRQTAAFETILAKFGVPSDGSFVDRFQKHYRAGCN